MKKNPKRKKFDRNSAFSMNLSDPNSSEKDATYCMIALDDRLICFSEKSIKEILTAETIDPDNEFPETRHSYQSLYNIGTNNSFVARTIIQAHDILDSVFLREGLETQKILDHVWTCSKLLLNCEESCHKIFNQTTELIHQCDSIISRHKESTFIPQLPQVEDLEQHVVSFLGYAKRFLEDSHKLFCIFFDSPNFESNFKSYRDWIRKNQPDSENLIKFLEQDKDWIQLIAWSRNALDANHSKPQFKVTIENFKIHKGNKFSSPTWRYDFREKNGDLQNAPSDIVTDMNIHMTNMLTFFEEMFLLCIKDNWNNNFNFQLYKHPDEKINKKCPTLYFVSLKQQA